MERWMVTEGQYVTSTTMCIYVCTRVHRVLLQGQRYTSGVTFLPSVALWHPLFHNNHLRVKKVSYETKQRKHHAWTGHSHGPLSLLLRTLQDFIRIEEQQDLWMAVAQLPGKPVVLLIFFTLETRHLSGFQIRDTGSNSHFASLGNLRTFILQMA